jgi:NAD(P)-dependent dehydrogenase (short-subunit alcohol dehydrogenase family)
MSKIAIVTGGSRGLGRNTALNIARTGGDVIITYQSREDDANAVVAEIEEIGARAIAVRLDVGKVSSFPRFVETIHTALRESWKRETFDHLINNAGHGNMATIESTTEEQFDKLINVHFKGVFFLTQALLPLLADAAAKGAVEVLSIDLAKELGSRGIAVNTVAPGAIETDFLGGAVRDIPELNLPITHNSLVYFFQFC